MEFLEGITLSAFLQERGRLRHKQALAIAHQLCAAIAEAHRSGILHRDLKSANVILCGNDDGSTRAVITDFGLSSGLTLPSGEMGGTPGYMAPELLRGQGSSKASDIYALGVILYETVTGSKPIRGETSQPDVAAVSAPGPKHNGRGLRPPVGSCDFKVP